LRSSLVPLVFLGVLGVYACASTEAGVPEAAVRSTTDPPSGGDMGRGQAEAASPAFAAPSGSPLCGVFLGRNTCMPDEDGSSRTSTTCASDDAGVLSACRVGPNGPTCVEASPEGVDGVPCGKGSDCAAGYECIRTPQGAVCRHYCCAGTCEGISSQNGGPTFCDVQTIARAERKAPVCMPIKKCRLLTPGECVRSETCAVITDKGDTGCVAIGPRVAGESCEDEHCAEGLTCLGSPGNRSCYALCRLDRPSCAAGQKCTTSALFNEPTYGVCR